MSDLKCAMHHPTHALADVGRKAAKRPLVTTGVVVAAVGLLGLYMMWPEIHRYVRMKRM